MRHVDSRGNKRLYDEVNVAQGTSIVEQTDQHTTFNTITCFNHKDIFTGSSVPMPFFMYRYFTVADSINSALCINGDNIDEGLIFGIVLPYSALSDYYNVIRTEIEGVTGTQAEITRGSLSVVMGSTKATEGEHSTEMRINDEMFVEYPYDFRNVFRIQASEAVPQDPTTGIADFLDVLSGATSSFTLDRSIDISWWDNDTDMIVGDVLFLPVYWDRTLAGVLDNGKNLVVFDRELLPTPNVASFSITTPIAWELIFNHHNWIKQYEAAVSLTSNEQ